MKPMIVFIRKNFKKKFQGKKNSKWLPKKSSFSSSANFHFFEKKFPGIGPWVSRID